MNSATKKSNPSILFEIAWEVCNQVGGIYTVIRSKVPAMRTKWDDQYVLLGPYLPKQAVVEFEPIYDLDDSPVARTVGRLRELGYAVHYGHWWLVPGQPRVVLFDPTSIFPQLDAIRLNLWQKHRISTSQADGLVFQSLAFSELVRIFLTEFAADQSDRTEIIAHFHEWMAAGGLPELVAEGVPVATVFTTHATVLGRYLAPHAPDFHARLSTFDVPAIARQYGIDIQVTLEKQAARHAHVFTTVSEITARECTAFLGRTPDIITPNGLEVKHLKSPGRAQVHHPNCRKRIDQFVRAHFFPSYSFDLDKTFYFFTAGRFEYVNKGYDLTLEAMARLNKKLKEANVDITIVLFVITKQPYHSISPNTLQSLATLNELQETTKTIEKQIGNRLFQAVTAASEDTMPDLNEFVEDYWRYRFRHTIMSWKSSRLPAICTHDLEQEDAVVNFCRRVNLINNQEDRVKVVYHPDFLTATNPLFGLDYNEFVCGCHLGVFPSFYEPWGYTPLECFVQGVPTVTSNVSGFGDYVLQTFRDYENRGVYVVNRKTQTFDQSADQLTNLLFRLIKMTRRNRPGFNSLIRDNPVWSLPPNGKPSWIEDGAEAFNWLQLRAHYDMAHQLAVKRRKPIARPVKRVPVGSPHPYTPG